MQDINQKLEKQEANIQNSNGKDTKHVLDISVFNSE